MTRPGLLVALFLAWTPILASASGEFTSPSPNLLYQLQQRNRSQPRLRVTADSSRLQLRVPIIDEAGLKGATSDGSNVPAPELIPWASIERIDEVVTRARRGRITGFVLGASAGALVGGVYGFTSTGGAEGAGGALIGAVAVGAVGIWIGGRIGERHVYEEPWYVAEPLPAHGPRLATKGAVLPVSGLLPPPPVVSTPFLRRPRGLPATAPATGAPRPEVLLACERIDRNDHIRMRGDFGFYQGRAGVFGPQGFEGLRTALDREGDASTSSLGVVTWDQIRSVDRRGNAAGKGALVGAISFGVFGGMLGAAAGSLSETEGAVIGGAAIGAALSGAFGAVLGAGVGSMFPAWHNVYRAR
jgi:hypothetical protein